VFSIPAFDVELIEARVAQIYQKQTGEVYSRRSMLNARENERLKYGEAVKYLTVSLPLDDSNLDTMRQTNADHGTSSDARVDHQQVDSIPSEVFGYFILKMVEDTKNTIMNDGEQTLENIYDYVGSHGVFEFNDGLLFY
jgi:hypothetical protein